MEFDKTNAIMKQIEEQNMLIQYMKRQYQDETGKFMQMPQTWTQFLNVDKEDAPLKEDSEDIKKELQQSKEQKEQHVSFGQTLQELNLPKKLVVKTKGAGMADTRKLAKTTTFDPKIPSHMISYLNLSNFASKGFNRSLFSDLIDSVMDMRCLHSIVLRNNGIDDSYFSELESLFSQPLNITSFDLSQNNIGKKGGLTIAKALSFKQREKNLQALDLSRNNFGRDTQVIVGVLFALRMHKELFHFCVDVNLMRIGDLHFQDQSRKDGKDHYVYDLSQASARVVYDNRNIVSMGLIDSHITLNGMKLVSETLASRDHHLTALNFRFSFIEYRTFLQLCRGISRNRTLVKLDLSNNGLESIYGIQLLEALDENINLNQLNLSQNLLENQFAFQLSRFLSQNQILQVIDISCNPIGLEGADSLISSLRSNQAIQSFGEIDSVDTMLGIVNIQVIQRILAHNQYTQTIRHSIAKETKLNTSEDPQNIHQAESTNTKNGLNTKDLTVAGYQIFTPVLLSNDLYQDPENFQLWNM